MEAYAWWASLRHEGLLMAPDRLAERFPAEPEPLTAWQVARLRRDVTRLEVDANGAEPALLRTVLGEVCGLGDPPAGEWLRGPHLDASWTRRDLTGAAVRPWGVWRNEGGALLPVFVDEAPRLGLGKGRRALARVVAWLRRSEQHVAVLTNGRQWRLVYAGLDHQAWAEGDVGQWFERGEPGLQVAALRALLSPRALTPPRPGEVPPLLAAIVASRRGQAELSSELGERVRRAVEALIQAYGPRLADLDEGVGRPDMYLAACRMVMRLVVVLFAEARDLLPRDNAVYFGSYGLDGLRQQLARAAGRAGVERLGQRYGAWPRVLALVRLVYAGSAHPDLPIPRYGGGLFAPGDADSTDPVARALAVFEDPEQGPSDAVVRAILDLVTTVPLRLRQGFGTMRAVMPVDFADLSTEYIGILYEGLLDFELRQAAGDDPVLFLALGDQPALPLSRLEGMDEAALRALLAKVKVRDRGDDGAAEDAGAGGGEAGDEAGEAEAEAGSGAEAEAELAAGGADDVAGAGGAGEAAEEDAVLAGASTAADEGDALQASRARAWAWARRAVAAGKLLRPPRGKGAAARARYEEDLDRAARGLIARLVLPGEWYLVRWGGTRKGAGTFYTPPGLAVPTVARTLRPLAYVAPPGPDGRPDELAPAAAWTVRKPAEILALSVLDNAMGSASFPVATLRFLTDALYESLYVHGGLSPRADGTLLTLPLGEPESGDLTDVFLPVALDSPDLEPLLRARLKRYVVERCIYGVDIDPLAVELARMALWIETMDRTLPFGFLDHKLKVGDSLVGCWFDHFRDYPALAWEREGGDKGHKGVHFAEGAWTKALKDFRNKRVKAELPAWITGQRHFLDQVDGRPPEALHEDLRSALDDLHRQADLNDPEALATAYRDRVVGSPAYRHLKEAFDTWCALWFWPADRLAEAPAPLSFDQPPEAAMTLVGELAARHRFFHWELEFPDVFRAPGSGFDAVLGNPPWEIQKPNSKEFFSNLDPLYRSYGKQEALRRQRELFAASTSDEHAWLAYSARFKALSNWGQNAGRPFGAGENDGARFNLGAGSETLHTVWRRRRAGWAGYADPEHPFRHQGSADINTYKLFLEQAHALLRPGGRLGLIVPSGVYTDKGTGDLRRLFLESADWRWLFGFENREGVFNIHRSFKFGPVIVAKTGRTEAVHAAFMHHDLADWEEADRHVVPYRRAQIERFSPNTLSILEVRTRRDIEVLEKIYANAVLLGDDGPDGWGIRYATEFHMTNDSHLFPPRPQWEAKGYRPDEYGRWIGPDGDVALPLYEGRMIGQFDFSAKGWVSGKGRTAVWREIPWEAKEVEPQYLMALTTARESGKSYFHPKLAYMRISSATNSRTTIATFIDAMPAGDSVFFFRSNTYNWADCMSLVGVLDSFAFDYQARAKLGGLNMSEFVMIETALPGRQSFTSIDRSWLTHVGRLAIPDIQFGHTWLQLRVDATRPWRRLWAITPHERLRLRCMLDAVVAELYGLDWSDLAYILRDCDHPAERMRQSGFTRGLDPKGFWRVDKGEDPELRHTVLTLAAFQDLKDTIARVGSRERGIAAFTEQHEGDGWMLPETLCLADLGLGHDERARRPQPVRGRLGERFLTWQLEQSAAESWAECERHARNLLGETEFARLRRELAGERGEERRVAEEPGVYRAGEEQGRLWGE